MFNPGAAGEGNGIISVIGSGIFKCFKTAENSLKLLTSALAKREPQNYMAHCWLSEGERERMVLGTDSGELLIIEGTELKATLQLDPGSTVVSIAAYSKVEVVPHLCHCCVFSPLLCFQPIVVFSAHCFQPAAACALAEVLTVVEHGNVSAWAYYSASPRTSLSVFTALKCF